jgi:hypothetical protein
MNQIIQHAECRKAISKLIADILKDETIGAHQELQAELYRKKSKWIHPTYNGIIEVYRAKIGDSWIMYEGFDYGPCSYSGKYLNLPSSSSQASGPRCKVSICVSAKTCHCRKHIGERCIRLTRSSWKKSKVDRRIELRGPAR